MIGFALEGGGAKGAFQVGAIKALYEMGIYPDVVVGSSIGAINGAFIASDELETLENIWLNSKLEDMMAEDAQSIQKVLQFDLKKNYFDIRAFVLETLKKGGLDVTPYKNQLRELLDEEKIRNSSVDFGLVTVSLTDFKPIEVFASEVPRGKLHDYIIASANFPAFKVDKIEDKTLLDGGFFNNLPVNLLLEKGCDRIFAIRLFGKGRIKKFKNENLVPIEYITPSEDLGHTLGIDPERARHNIRLGYLDAMRVLKRMKSKRFYVEHLPSEVQLLNTLNQVSEADLHPLEALLDSNLPPRRFIYEILLPFIASSLSLPSSSNYLDIMLSFYEWVADYYKVERLELYSYEAFIKAIACAYTAPPSHEKMSGFSTRTLSFLSKKKREQLLLEIYKGLCYNSTSKSENVTRN